MELVSSKQLLEIDEQEALLNDAVRDFLIDARLK